ncbi:MAG: 2-isopropylmalate synthase [Myxococcales bacterium]|nr:2-isopropylmalate synthase [Myxococcales bacterium]MCB9519493.1 2-isopropylmalate synthase [Myxococcales bacterium]MCB9532093.1 2-isopropylmalate synthase [Myxococcales bacterium]MCB9533282.1 2-isopropylmalate synthase [Myxococcales bacterium]
MNDAQGRRVLVFDTTLRDGEQSPGATMTLEEKLQIAAKLELLGVDVIEAGFPVASPGELECVRAIAGVVKSASVAALCRTRQGDIEAAWEAIREAAHPRLHVFIATSDLHLHHKLRMTRAEVLDEIARGVAACRALCADVEFSAEDATRSDPDFLAEAMAVAVRAGATVLNVPDTVGYAVPHEYGALIARIVAVAGDRAIVSAHCHDDLGLAVANSLAAVAAGARQVECCVNGIGERAGNAALEEVVMALRTRHDALGCETGINPRHLVAVSRLVSDVTGFPMQPNKAIVGRNAFAHESGIHQHGVLTERTTYEIMDPAEVGFATTSLVLGKHSGRHALGARLAELGYEVDGETLADVFARFKALGERKKQVYDEDLRALMSQHAATVAGRFTLRDVRFAGGLQATATGAVTLLCGDEEVSRESAGDGPVDAVLAAIREAAGSSAFLEDYTISAVTGGADAQGRVYVGISDGAIRARGQAAHTDVVVASALAFVDALNGLDRAQQSAIAAVAE